ncbi:MAG: chromate resistance protein, partial [Vicinamibacterales bacterium]
LPNRDAAREDLEWVKSEIVGLGGTASLFVADAVDDPTDAVLVGACREARARDIADLRRRCERWLQRTERHAARTQRLVPDLTREARAFVAEWRALTAITYFDSPGMAETEDIVQRIAQRSSGRPPSSPASSSDLRAYRGRTWVTRPRPGVDRMATAWLIRTHIDPHARFTFAEAAAGDTVAFDMYGADFGHHDDRCTFEVVAARFGLGQARVAWIGRIVHDLDLREQRYGEPEAPGVALMVEGLRRLHADDAALLEHGIALFESLAQARTDGATTPRRTSGRPARARSSMRRTPRGAK